MAQSAVVRMDRLDIGLVLTPERYDPRRLSTSFTSSLSVADLADIIREQVMPGKVRGDELFLILDTSDAWNGVILTTKKPMTADNIGSAKKIIRHGDVIISRLRPYLRQVAYVDSVLADKVGGDVTICCSSEFYVLRSRDHRSIAFLVPLLLSDPIQKILFASQEGGNHPRFNQTVLESLAIPEALIEIRDDLSKEVETAVSCARRADMGLRSLVAKCSEMQPVDPN
jgi:hypothetical protein